MPAVPGGTFLLAEEVAPAEGDGPADEPPWRVVVSWGGRDGPPLTQPGNYPLVLPLGEGRAPGRAALQLRRFKVVSLDVGGHAVEAELADTPDARAWGLQGRRGLAPDQGMLFFFPQPAQPRFVMKTVSFPLSLAFIDARGTIVQIGRMRPGDQGGVAPFVPVHYVLEMEQGWFRAHGVGIGAKVTMP